jgi:hypothetical protein
LGLHNLGRYHHCKIPACPFLAFYLAPTLWSWWYIWWWWR